MAAAAFERRGGARAQPPFVEHVVAATVGARRNLDRDINALKPLSREIQTVVVRVTAQRDVARSAHRVRRVRVARCGLWVSVKQKYRVIVTSEQVRDLST